MVTWVNEISPAGRRALIETARKSLSLHPEQTKAWTILGELLLEAGLFEEANHTLTEAASLLPAEPKVLFLFADALQRVGKADAALAVLETVPSFATKDQNVALRQFDLFVETGRWDKVTQNLERIASIASSRRSVILAHGYFASNGGDPENLLAACEAALMEHPGSTVALHYKAIALALLRRNDEANSVMGLNNFVSVADSPPEEAHINGTPLFDALEAEILQNPTLVPDPHGKATRGGFQTRALAQAGDKAVPALLDRIKSAVDHYVETLPAMSHPFTTTRPARVRLRAWAVVYPRDGRQKSHFHSSGWISGVTYITAPRAAGDAKYRGPLVLGELDSDRYPDTPPWGTREIDPMPGRVALFPSFVPHATRSTGLSERRICVAFDVVPK
jgi:tetratricopeptide (TPR) repeat protein